MNILYIISYVMMIGYKTTDTEVTGFNNGQPYGHHQT